MHRDELASPTRADCVYRGELFASVKVRIDQRGSIGPSGDRAGTERGTNDLISRERNHRRVEPSMPLGVTVLEVDWRQQRNPWRIARGQLLQSRASSSPR